MTAAQLTQNFLGKLLIGALLVFALYSNVRLIVRNNKLNERIREAKEEIAQKELRNRKLELLIAYYQSPSYQDAEARRRLGLKRPDEKVVVVKGIDSSNASKPLESSIYENVEPTAPIPESNFSRWWKYFFSER